MSTTEETHRALRSALIDALGPDCYVPAVEAIKLGVPKSQARNFQTASARVLSVEEADDVASYYSEAIARHADDAHRYKTPAELAAEVCQW